MPVHTVGVKQGKRESSPSLSPRRARKNKRKHSCVPAGTINQRASVHASSFIPTGHVSDHICAAVVTTCLLFYVKTVGVLVAGVQLNKLEAALGVTFEADGKRLPGACYLVPYQKKKKTCSFSCAPLPVGPISSPNIHVPDKLSAAWCRRANTVQCDLHHDSQEGILLRPASTKRCVL